jgi:hypothetical protein
MTLEGHIENGQIVLDQQTPLPEGVRVRVELLDREAPRPPSEVELPTLYERYRDIIGQAKDLPSDFAENHDHYIHGAPKKS